MSLEIARDLYLQNAPINDVLKELLRDEAWTTEKYQDRVVHEIINHPLFILNGRMHQYERSFIRKYFDLLMEKDVYISDLFATEYGRVHTTHGEDGEYHYQYYVIPKTAKYLQVKLRSSSNCTAFQTWGACFAFLEWVIDHCDLFCNRRILEVGSGSGLCGQMMKCLIPSCEVVLSDYCDDVTEYILGNIEQNATTFLELGVTTPSVVTIDFCNFCKEQIQEIHGDYLIATDVTFSPDLVEGLATLIGFALHFGSYSKALICCTIRSQEMIDIFTSALSRYHLQIKTHTLQQKGVWYYFKYAEIILLEISP